MKTILNGLGIEEHKFSAIRQWFDELELKLHDDPFVNNEFYINFLNTPSLLKTFYQLSKELNIYSVSDKGITFFLCEPAMNPAYEYGKSLLTFQSGMADGSVFVPMHNIESINTSGSIVINR